MSNPKIKFIVTPPPDATVENSDASYTNTVASGGTLVVPDINIEVNTVVEGTIPALKDVKILITDGVNPVTPDDVSVVGDTVTVEVPSGGGPSFDPDAFVLEVATMVTGTTNSNQFRIIVLGAGNNYDVKTSDGQTINGNTGNLTITFPSEGRYTIEIKGSIYPYYRDNVERNKLISILNWGNVTYLGLFRAFQNCANLDILATDTPTITFSIGDLFHVSGIIYNSTINNWDVSLSSGNGVFRGASKFNQPLNSWVMTGFTSLQNFFSGAVSFNQPLSNWNVGSCVNMQDMFNNAQRFNQDLSMWNVSGVTNMANMFTTASLFNQNLGAWQLNSGLTTMSQIFRNSGMSTANYTDTIVGWANHVFDNGGAPSGVNMSTQSNRTFDTSRSGGANFADAGAARTYLTTTATWTITGDAVI